MQGRGRFRSTIIGASVLGAAWSSGAFAAQPLIMRLALEPNSVLTSVKSASIKVSTTNKKGADGLLLSVKITDAMDGQGMLADTTVNVRMSLTGGTGCTFGTTLGTAVDIVGGTGKAKVVATNNGDLAEVPAPTFLRLCLEPRILSADFQQTIARLHLFDPRPGTILSGPFHLATNGPITSWKNGKIQVKSASGDIQAKIAISGAMEGAVPSTRTIIPLMPAFDGVSCSTTPYFLSAILLEKGSGKTTIDHLELGGSDPGRCVPERVELEDAGLAIVSDGIGVVQGIDPD